MKNSIFAGNREPWAESLIILLYFSLCTTFQMLLPFPHLFKIVNLLHQFSTFSLLDIFVLDEECMGARKGYVLVTDTANCKWAAPDNR